MQKNDNYKIIVTGGGSGGHTMTAVAVIEKILDKYPYLKDNLVYIGGNLGMEGEKRTDSLDQRVISSMGVHYLGIRSGKLQRKVSLTALFGLFGVVGGIIDAYKFFKSNSVSFVFSTGGYVSVPICLVAGFKKIPVIIHEQTTRVGLSNKICSYFAKKILVGFEESRRYFSKDKVIFTGNPVRKCVTDAKCWSKSVIQKLRFFEKKSKEYPIVLISGGGQGSHIINEVVKQSLNQLLLDFQVILLCGDNKVYQDYKCINKAVKKLSPEFQKRIIVEKFVNDDIGALYDVADIYIGRGGALSIYEVGIVGIPSIIIPIPWVTHNEQFYNAKVLEDLGLAMILSEGELSSEIFVQRLKKFKRDIGSGVRDVDKKALKQKFITDSDNRIVNELEPYLKEYSK